MFAAVRRPFRMQPNVAKQLGCERRCRSRQAVMVLDAAPSPRCKLEESGVTFGDVGDRRSLVIGDAIPSKTVFSVGARALAGDRTSSARRACSSIGKLAEQWIIAKGTEIVADAPPPIPLIGRGCGLRRLYLRATRRRVRLAASKS